MNSPYPDNPEKVLPARPLPEWLKKIKGDSPFDINNILKNSLYYPSSALDGDPVRYLGGYIHSFVYVDYGVKKARLVNNLYDRLEGFKGYDVLFTRDMREKDLVPNGWTPVELHKSDGDPMEYRKNMVTPYAVWTVLQRKENYSDSHGPERFSLLYIAGDGAATFNALYHANKTYPDIVAVIQPGEAFGFNWTNFRDEKGIFGRLVLKNPYGKPEYLLYGGWGSDYKPACWEEYSELIRYWKLDKETGGELGLWF